MKKKSDYFEDCGRVGVNLKEENTKNMKHNFLDNEINNNNNEKNFEFLEQKRKREKISYDPKIEAKIKVMEYIYENEKKNLNRNTILRIPIPSSSNQINNNVNTNTGLENILSLCNRFFTKNSNNKSISETQSFLDELTMENDDFQQNKAIIIVPSNFYPGNICYENAKKFLIDAT